MSALHLIFGYIVSHRIWRSLPSPPEERPDFVQTGHARLSPAAAVFDPRSPELVSDGDNKGV